MSTMWTQEKILSLAPDASSAKNGKSLAVRHKWLSLNCNEQAIWGECQGSGKNPYRTQIDITEPAFKCSCPSRKFPCKHGLGLFLLFANSKDNFHHSTPPDWVSQWLNTRQQKQIEKQKTAAKKTVDPKAKVKRAEQRYNKVKAGMEDLEVWLRDLLRQGLAVAQAQPYSFWDTAAARLVDAQAGGVARLIKEMGSIPHTGKAWEERLLTRLGSVYLLLEGFKRLDKLPTGLQADVRSQIGWTQSQEELLTKSGVEDEWLILGQRVEEQDALKAQRIWLWGTTTRKAALILNFVYGKQPLDTSLVLGSCIEGELVFFDSAYPLRAIVKHRQGEPKPIQQIPGYSGVKEMMGVYAQALSCHPWLEQFPVLLNGVIPFQEQGKWLIRDAQNHQLPLMPSFSQGWQLLAISGGHCVDLFGEWNGEYLLPLSIWADNAFLSF
ncbi:MAG: SWIM zinc finger family protein [Calothrix sp. MO_167.B42]|nr:SWIM zinc finger family protein [Calothrix sp. MO_167.B42]